MTPNDRRHPTTQAIARWLALSVGVFTVVGVLIGAGISYGQHMRADEEQDARLNKLEERIHDLEKANRYLHGENGLLPNAPRDPRP